MFKEWTIEEGDSPIIALAVHNGHYVHEEFISSLAIDEETRLREEDPYTGRWVDIVDTRVVVDLSRFEVDLNRPSEKAVYISPDLSWGLDVWKTHPAQEEVDRLLKIHNSFYSDLKKLLDKNVSRCGRVIVLDLHSYNHRRKGPDAEYDDPSLNPEVNVGTGTMDRGRWSTIVDGFIEDLKAFNFNGRTLDVRENVRFKGGNVPAWVHENYPKQVCVLAVEVKKFFMNEWTGELYEKEHDLMKCALQSTLPGLIERIT
jgi:N-formylglutamate amidohydrolase